VNSHSISPLHCSTPLPINCAEDFISNKEASLDISTPSSYLIIMHGGQYHSNSLFIQSKISYMVVASVYRAFYDRISELAHSTSGKIPIRDSYEQVLKADGELQSVVRSVPKYIQKSNYPLHDYPSHVHWQRRTFTISVAHKVR
jgi:hypothetical protein